MESSTSESHLTTQNPVRRRSSTQRETFPEGDSCDEGLLQRFVADRDDHAFAELVTRHSSLVMGVCRRALGNRQDAEDAFQATFLVLARKAATVRWAKSLSGWLYRTAYRIALRARAKRAQRRELPVEGEIVTATETFSRIARDYDHVVLDEEIDSLPEGYRLPLILCCLDGKSRDEAAHQLGLTTGALKGRLERARSLLRRKLLLRGVSMSVTIGVLAGMQQSAQAATVVAPSLIVATVHAGVQHAAGDAALGYVSENALHLATGSSPFMSAATAKSLACLVVAGCVAALANAVPSPTFAGDFSGDTIELTSRIDDSEISDTPQLMPVYLQTGAPRRATVPAQRPPAVRGASAVGRRANSSPFVKRTQGDRRGAGERGRGGQPRARRPGAPPQFTQRSVGGRRRGTNTSTAKVQKGGRRSAVSR